MIRAQCKIKIERNELDNIKHSFVKGIHYEKNLNFNYLQSFRFVVLFLEADPIGNMLKYLSQNFSSVILLLNIILKEIENPKTQRVQKIFIDAKVYQ